MLFKRILFYFPLLFSFLLLSSVSFAQLISGDAFLQGHYLEIGMAPNGAFGSANHAPPAYHARVGSGDTRLGFVADPAKDGWTVGTPAYFGDYFLPGSPQEGWDVQVDGIAGKAWRISGATSFSGGMTGKVISVSTTGSHQMALWEGEFGDLSIAQVTQLPVNSLYFTVTVRLKNTGSTTLHNIYYDRTFDADNEATLSPIVGPGFTTINKIESQLPNPSGRVMVSATGEDYKSFIGLGTNDCRAKAYILDMSLVPSTTLDDIYNQSGIAAAYHYAAGYIDTTDVGAGLVFNIGDLAPGDSAVLSYAYVLGLPELDSAFGSISPFFVVSGLPYRSGDTIRSCSGDTLDLAITNTSLNSWIWSPAGIGATGGLTDKIIVGHTARRYRVTGISTVCSYPDTLWLTISPYIPKPILSVSGPVMNVGGSYAGYQWYRDLVAIPGAGSAAYTAGTTGDYYCKVIDVQGCEAYSDTAHITGTGIAGIDAKHDNIQLYPNPATDKVFIASGFPLNVSLCDVTGRVLMEYRHALEVDLSAYKGGLYLLVITDEDGKAVTVKKINKVSR